MLSSNSYTLFNKNQLFNLKDGLAYLRPTFNSEEKIGTVFSKKKLEERRLFIKDGILYDNDKKPVSGRVIYILDEHGDLYGEEFHIDGVNEKFKTKHSYFKGDKPVRAAGFLKADENGKVIGIDNDSGHFSLTLQQMVPALDYFFSCGCENVEFSNHEFAAKHKIVHHDLKEILSYKNHFSICGDIPETLKVNRITIKPTASENTSSEETLDHKKYFSRYGADPITITPISTENSNKESVMKNGEKRKNLDDITNTNFSPRLGEDDAADVKSSDPSSKKRKTANSTTFVLLEKDVNDMADAYDTGELPIAGISKKFHR